MQEIYHNGKSFFLYQPKNALAVTSDSIQLVDFITLRNSDNIIVDVGSGIGTLPIVLCTKTKKKIVGFEIQSDICDIFHKNVSYNNLEDQITVISDKIQNFRQYFPFHSVDIVISNPPYFKVEEKSKFNCLESKTIARHEVTLNFDELARCASNLLKQHGKFFFIHQSVRLTEILQTLERYKLEPKRIQFIYPSRNHGSTLFLMEASFMGKSGLTILEPKIIKE